MASENYELTIHTDEWAEEFQLHSFLHRQYSEMAKSQQNHLFDDLKLIGEQNELIRQIRERVYSKADHSLFEETGMEAQEAFDKSFLVSKENSTFISTRSQLFQSRAYLRTEGSIDEPSRLTKRLRTQLNSSLSQALCEIEQRCSRDTCEVICKLLTEDQQRLTSLKTLETELSRVLTEIAIYKQRYEQQSKQVSLLQDKLKFMESQISTRTKSSVERERNLSRLQTSLVIKEHKLNEDSKKLNMKMQQLLNKQNVLNDQRKEVDCIWERIVEQIESQRQCEQSFKTMVLSRCKESLRKQRKMLSQEQQNLDKEHETIERFIAQLRQHKAFG